MSSDTVKNLVEQMSGTINRYLDPTLDLDHLGVDEINSNIMDLQAIQNSQGNVEEVNVVMGLISQILTHLYVARGHAIADVPRDISFYSSIESVKSLLRQIKNMNSGPSIFSFFK